MHGFTWMIMLRLAILGLHWRLNPLMQNVVGVEVLKHVYIIYPTFNCILVSPTQVML